MHLGVFYHQKADQILWIDAIEIIEVMKPGLFKIHSVVRIYKAKIISWIKSIQNLRAGYFLIS